MGLFGGTFDPPHAGHVHLAEAAQEALGLDRVLFIPAARSPHKQPGSALAAEDRVAMLEALCAPRPSWSVSRVEIERRGISYTIDTVEALLAEGELGEEPPSLLLGGDQLARLFTWHRLADLLAIVRPVVIHRGRDAEGQRAALVRSFPAEMADLAELILAGFLELPPVDISSTDLRERLGRGQDPGADVPAEVMARIRELGLYGWKP